jgi:GGDEF domain-containing protein
MMDIDHFRRFNDMIGHLRGNECLVVPTSTLRYIAPRKPAAVASRPGKVRRLRWVLCTLIS